MSLVVLFPGQGVQHPDMLRWLDAHPLARPTLDAMAARIGTGWRARLAADPAWATGNATAQCLMTGLGLAVWQVLAPRLPRPVAVAGYSVGELAACGAAGVYGVEAALDLAAHRASAMDAASAGTAAGLLAVTGLDRARLAAVCERFGLSVAIHLGPDKWVLGGTSPSLATAAEALSTQGVEAVPLKVRIASHTPAMQPAAQAFAAHLGPLPWSPAQAWVVTDVDGLARRDVAGLKAALAAQVDHPVQWAQALDTLGERRPSCVLEAGPGTSLARLWRARHPAVPVRSADEFQGDDAIVAWVQDHLAT